MTQHDVTASTAHVVHAVLFGSWQRAFLFCATGNNLVMTLSKQHGLHAIRKKTPGQQCV